MADETGSENKLPEISVRLDVADWTGFAATTVFALAGYLITLAPSVTLGWSGIMTTAAMYGGVTLPHGYPVWTIYSWLLIKLLPFSNPVWRVAAGSAILGALTCGLVALMVSRSGKILFQDSARFRQLNVREQNWVRGMAGYTAGLALAFSGGFWKAAVTADAGTFSVFLMAVLVWLLMRWWETKKRHCCWLVFLIYGLLLTDSRELIVVLPGLLVVILLIDQNLGRDFALIAMPLGAMATCINPNRFPGSYLLNLLMLALLGVVFLTGVVLAIKTRKVGSEWKTIFVCALLFLAGLATYLYLPIISTTNPPVNWGYTRTWEGFVHLVSGDQFDKAHPATSASAFARQLLALMGQTGRELGWLYLAFAVVPFCFFRHLTNAMQKWVGILLAISICIGPLLAALLNFPFDKQSQGLAEEFFYNLRMPLAIWAGMGMILFAATVATPRLADNTTPA